MKNAISFDNIGGGALRACVDELIEEVEKNVIDEPLVPGARTVTIKVTITPDLTAAGSVQINAPEIKWQASKTLPAIKGQSTHGIVESLRGGSRIVLNDADPLAEHHPKQTSIFEKGENV